MKHNWKITFLSGVLTIGLLSACSAEKRDSLNQETDVNFRPIHYDRKTNVNESNNDYKTHENKRFLHDEIPGDRDEAMEKGK